MKMTTQEIFDKVAAHLLAQRRPSIAKGGACAYRGPDGTMCAAGVLIPDELYHSYMEGFAIRDLINREPPLAYLKPHTELVVVLQTIHDKSTPYWDEVPGKLRKMANHFNLNTKVLDDA